MQCLESEGNPQKNPGFQGISAISRQSSTSLRRGLVAERLASDQNDLGLNPSWISDFYVIFFLSFFLTPKLYPCN